MKHVFFRLFSLTFAVAFLLTATAARAQPVLVDQVVFPVTLSDGHTYSLVGYYYHGCQLGLGHRALQVLLHGATYNHGYWDAHPAHQDGYSYAEHMVGEGYDVLALDQLGAGRSAHPDGDSFTIDEAASSLHQVMVTLRTDHNPMHQRFETVVLVGHSLGSITAVYSEGMHADADALVVTGLALTPHPSPVPQATLGALLVTPYVSFPPSLRTELFYYAPGADPNVIAYDNTTLIDEVPRGDFETGLQLSIDPDALGASAIPEPVLIMLGEHDVTAPASLAPTEAAYYSGAASVTVRTAFDVGHAVNLHLAREAAWEQIDHWLHGEVWED